VRLRLLYLVIIDKTAVYEQRTSLEDSDVLLPGCAPLDVGVMVLFYIAGRTPRMPFPKLGAGEGEPPTPSSVAFREMLLSTRGA
jgi:hypothetical protein